MFYHLTLSRPIDVHPRFFGPQLRSVIDDTVKTKVEGVCLGQIGFCVCVTALRDAGLGLIRPDGTGLATFQVKYDAIVFRPFRGEVLDVTIQKVMISGFVAEAGPVEVFVSAHSFPESYTFTTDRGGAFESVLEQTQFAAGTDVRVRIVSVRVEANEIKCVGTFKGDELGIVP